MTRIQRTGERLMRAAYTLEDIANQLTADGYGDEGRGIRQAARTCGTVGRNLARGKD